MSFKGRKGYIAVQSNNNNAGDADIVQVKGITYRYSKILRGVKTLFRVRGLQCVHYPIKCTASGVKIPLLIALEVKGTLILEVSTNSRVLLAYFKLS
jgi:hypothetical protein